MAKTKETINIENNLYKMCDEKRIYGCHEVTIGFYNNGHGNEIVDFCTMDSKGILRCYEIKVTMQDLKSKAKKSWYGHYNYLVVSRSLLEKIKDNIDDYIPDWVGVATTSNTSWGCGVSICRNAKKRDLTKDDEIMLKESMIRSMYYKMQKYKDANNLDKMKSLKSELSRTEKENKKLTKEVNELRYSTSYICTILRKYYNYEFHLLEFIDDFIHERIHIPEKIELNITERGKDYNKRVFSRKNRND